MKTLKQIEWIYRVYESLKNVCEIELKLIEIATPFDPITLKKFVPKKWNDADIFYGIYADDTDILYGIYEMIEKHKTDAIQLQITTIDCDLCNITIKLLKTKEGD